MRLVLDTNVLLAGVATHGICEALLTLCFRDHTIVLSEHILSEFVEHYVGKFTASQDQAAVVADIIRKHSEIVVPATLPHTAVADLDDLPVLGTAIAAQADCLITGDKELLELNTYQNIPIVSPRQFYDRIRAGS